MRRGPTRASMADMSKTPLAGAPPARGLGPREGLEAGLVWPRGLRDPDGPTQWQARSGQWRKSSWGLYVPADVGHTPRQRVVEAAAAVWPQGVVTGWAALTWRGARWLDGTPPAGAAEPVDVHIGVGQGSRTQPDIVVATQESIPPWAVERCNGIRTASSVWAVAFAMRYAPSLSEAVRIFDMAAYDDLIALDELARCTEAVMGTRMGVQQLRDALPLVSENSWSPAETSMRLIWHLQAGRPAPLANRAVFDETGRRVGTPDLVDFRAGVYGQYEGARVHLVGSQRSADIRQEAAYRAVGLEGVSMVAMDLSDPAPFINRLDQAYERAARQPSSNRRWLQEPPNWWTSTSGVAIRRALVGAQRERLLAYRRDVA